MYVLSQTNHDYEKRIKKGLERGFRAEIEIVNGANGVRVSGKSRDGGLFTFSFR